MPQISGLDVIDRARKMYERYGLKHLFPKSIMLTAVGDERLQDHIDQHKKVDFFIQKPAPPDLFEDTVRELLKLK